MFTWYLIMMIIPAHPAGGSSIDKVEMVSEDSCHYAGNSFLNAGSGNFRTSYICIKE